MIARDVMSAEVLSVTDETPLREIAKILLSNGIGGITVVDGGGVPIGMVSRNDMIAMYAKAENAPEPVQEWWLTHLADGIALAPGFLSCFDRKERAARDVMVSPVVTASETTDIPELARLFIRHRIRRIPVIRDGVMVGIVNRTDLLGCLAAEPARTEAPEAPKPGMLKSLISDIELRFAKPDDRPMVTRAKATTAEAFTAKAFHGLVEAFGQRKAHQQDMVRQTGVDHRKKIVQGLTDGHITDDSWKDILHQAKTAAASGEKEMLLLRFPCGLCSDSGRAIDVLDPDWPETLRGEAAEIYLRWKRDLKLNGFELIAQVIDFPDDAPGDIGLTLVWGE